MASMLRVLIFDFDGVILESADIKTHAFRELFSSYPDKVDAIVAYHETNAGISRFQKFKHIYQHFLGRPLGVEEEQALGERFSALALEAVKRCPFVPGAPEFLQAYSRTLQLFVASGTPEDELRRLVAARGLTAFFRKVYGSPTEKTAVLEEILLSTGMQRAALLFVGDGRSDYEAARAAGVEFIGRARSGKKHPFEGLSVPVVGDLFELDRCLSTRVGSLKR
jgi:phosphoglycolate phosphatase-like HAD superfamily hydrolase